ncbi:GGDEF domain-containing protein [Colwellia psychrerythraea]|uniref:diguanylate cyclase n=1 Tax=Colwellia psychrerythraea TaxID=28229 RepID=A0A099KJE2_COLPS|nr:GGDEF domain-containing protein [Colwellia psychrerythraea]KGJ89693.1 diguanylate cyclase [Colwellia psychrerythraea]
MLTVKLFKSKIRTTINFCFGIIILLTFFLQNALSAPSNNINVLLEAADKTRSSNPVEYSVLLDKLKPLQKMMSLQQSDYFDYLTAYQLIYKGKAKQATTKLLSLLSSKAHVSIKFRARLTLVNIFGIEQNWSEGLLHLSKALKELSNTAIKKETKEEGLAIAAIFYNQIGQYDLSLNYANKLTLSSANTRSLCIAAMSSVESRLHLNKLEDETTDIEDAITLCKNEPIAANFIRSNRAKFDIAKNHHFKVIKSLSPQIEQVESTRYPRLIVEIYAALAQAYLMQDNLKKATEFSLKTIKTGESIKTTQAVVLAYKLLYQITLQQKEYRQALNYHEQHAKLDKANLDEIQAKHLAFQLAQHKSFEQKSKIRLLKEKNALLISKQALAKAKVANVQMFIAILTVTIALLMLWGGRLWKSHKRVKELAEYDALTGIYNRGHFTQVTKIALKYCKSAQQDLSVIMFDLDHFKLVNDNFGHACGDWALKETIKACQNIGRKNDIFARLGGEEFCLVLPSCNINAAMLRAEACRAAIEAIITEESGCDFSITASFGVTDVKRSGFDLDKLLADSDGAAYASKHAGRNRVTIFQVPGAETDKA